MNKCIECADLFEPDSRHWLFCPVCQRLRDRQIALDLDRLLARASKDPSAAELLPEIKEARECLERDIYS